MKRYPPAIRAIAIILIATFLAQDIVWADPEIRSCRPSTLQIPSKFDVADPATFHKTLIKLPLKYILEMEDVSRFDLLLPPIMPYAGIEVVFDFSPPSLKNGKGQGKYAEGKDWVVPCYLRDKEHGYLWRYEAVIHPDKSFELRDPGERPEFAAVEPGPAAHTQVSNEPPPLPRTSTSGVNTFNEDQAGGAEADSSIASTEPNIREFVSKNDAGNFGLRLGVVIVTSLLIAGAVLVLWHVGIFDRYIALKNSIPPGAIFYLPAALLDAVTGVLSWTVSDINGQYLNKGRVRFKQSVIVGTFGIAQGVFTHILLNIPDLLPILPFGQSLFRTIVVLTGGMMISVIFARATSFARKAMNVAGYEERKELGKTGDVVFLKLCLAPFKTHIVANILPPPARVITEQVWDYFMTIAAAYLMNRDRPGLAEMIRHIVSRAKAHGRSIVAGNASHSSAVATGQSEGAGLSGLDTPILDRMFVQYDMEVVNFVNPEHREGFIGVYGGSGADVSNFLYSTDAAEAYFVDISAPTYLELNAACGAWETTPVEDEYTLEKRSIGYGRSEQYLKGGKISKRIIQELKGIGVDRHTVRVELSSGGSARLIFRWAYPGTHTEREYSITFINANIVEPDSYPDELRDILCGKETIDVYYQRAGLSIPAHYPQFMPSVGRALKAGGFCVTDDNARPDYMTYDPAGDLERSGAAFMQGAMFVSGQMIELAEIINERHRRAREKFGKGRKRDGYGWNVAIRQKRCEETSEASWVQHDSYSTDFIKGIEASGLLKTPHKRIAVSGCGLKHSALYIARNAVAHTPIDAFDISDGPVEDTKAVLAESGLADKVNVFRADLAGLSTYDAIFLNVQVVLSAAAELTEWYVCPTDRNPEISCDDFVSLLYELEDHLKRNGQVILRINDAAHIREVIEIAGFSCDTVYEDKAHAPSVVVRLMRRSEAASSDEPFFTRPEQLGHFRFIRDHIRRIKESGRRNINNRLMLAFFFIEGTVGVVDKLGLVVAAGAMASGSWWLGTAIVFAGGICRCTAIAYQQTRQIIRREYSFKALAFHLLLYVVTIWPFGIGFLAGTGLLAGYNVLDLIRLRNIEYKVQNGLYRSRLNKDLTPEKRMVMRKNLYQISGDILAYQKMYFKDPDPSLRLFRIRSARWNSNTESDICKYVSSGKRILLIDSQEPRTRLARELCNKFGPEYQRRIYYYDIDQYIADVSSDGGSHGRPEKYILQLFPDEPTCGDAAVSRRQNNSYKRYLKYAGAVAVVAALSAILYILWPSIAHILQGAISLLVVNSREAPIGIGAAAYVFGGVTPLDGYAMTDRPLVAPAPASANEQASDDVTSDQSDKGFTGAMARAQKKTAERADQKSPQVRQEMREKQPFIPFGDNPVAREDVFAPKRDLPPSMEDVHEAYLPEKTEGLPDPLFEARGSALTWLLPVVVCTALAAAVLMLWPNGAYGFILAFLCAVSYIMWHFVIVRGRRIRRIADSVSHARHCVKAAFAYVRTEPLYAARLLQEAYSVVKISPDKFPGRLIRDISSCYNLLYHVYKKNDGDWALGMLKESRSILVGNSHRRFAIQNLPDLMRSYRYAAITLAVHKRHSEALALFDEFYALYKIPRISDTFNDLAPYICSAYINLANRARRTDPVSSETALIRAREIIEEHPYAVFAECDYIISAYYSLSQAYMKDHANLEAAEDALVQAGNLLKTYQHIYAVKEQALFIAVGWYRCLQYARTSGNEALAKNALAHVNELRRDVWGVSDRDPAEVLSGNSAFKIAKIVSSLPVEYPLTAGQSKRLARQLLGFYLDAADAASNAGIMADALSALAKAAGLAEGATDEKMRDFFRNSIVNSTILIEQRCQEAGQYREAAEMMHFIVQCIGGADADGDAPKRWSGFVVSEASGLVRGILGNHADARGEVIEAVSDEDADVLEKIVRDSYSMLLICPKSPEVQTRVSGLIECYIDVEKAFIKAGLIDNAKAILGMALDIFNKNNGNARFADVVIARGYIALISSDADKDGVAAMDHTFSAIVGQDENNVLARIIYAFLCVKEDRFDEALALIGRSVFNDRLGVVADGLKAVIDVIRRLNRAELAEEIYSIEEECRTEKMAEFLPLIREAANRARQRIFANSKREKSVVEVPALVPDTTKASGVKAGAYKPAKKWTVRGIRVQLRDAIINGDRAAIDELAWFCQRKAKDAERHGNITRRDELLTMRTEALDARARILRDEAKGLRGQQCGAGARLIGVEQSGQSSPANLYPEVETIDAIFQYLQPNEIEDVQMLARRLKGLLAGESLTNKVVLAFDEGLQSKAALSVFDVLQSLKKDPDYARLLSRLEVVRGTARSLKNKISPLVSSGAEVYLFANSANSVDLKDIKFDILLSGRGAVAYIDDGQFPVGAYYPLAQIVAITLAASHKPEILAHVSEVCRALSIDKPSFTMDGAILFKLLPDAVRLETGDLIRKYCTIKQLLAAA